MVDNRYARELDRRHRESQLLRRARQSRQPGGVVAAREELIGAIDRRPRSASRRVIFPLLRRHSLGHFRLGSTSLSASSTASE